MQGTRFQVAEEHYRGDNQDGCAKKGCKDYADDRDGDQGAQIFIIAASIAVMATDVSGSMVHVDVDPKLVLKFSSDSVLDRFLPVGRSGGRHVRGGQRWARCGETRGQTGRDGRRCRRRRWGLAQHTEAERDRSEAGKKRYFHSYPLAVRCSGHASWIQYFASRSDN